MKQVSNKQFSNLSKKQCIEMIANYRRNIKDAERFYKDCLEREINNYKAGIVDVERILLTKYKTVIK